MECGLLELLFLLFFAINQRPAFNAKPGALTFSFVALHLLLGSQIRVALRLKRLVCARFFSSAGDARAQRFLQAEQTGDNNGAYLLSATPALSHYTISCRRATLNGQ